MPEPVSNVFDAIKASRTQFKSDPSTELLVIGNLHKAMIIAAGTWMEYRIMSMIRGFYETSPTFTWQPLFVDRMALEKKFFQLFNFKESNCSQFWGIFGSEVKEAAKEAIKNDPSLADLEAAFMSICTNRNLAAHTYSSYVPELSPEETYDNFQRAEQFVDYADRFLRRFVPVTSKGSDS